MRNYAWITTSRDSMLRKRITYLNKVRKARGVPGHVVRMCLEELEKVKAEQARRREK